MKIEKPISERQMPVAKKRGHYKYLELYEAVMKLPPGKVLPVTVESEDQAKKFGLTIQHSTFAEFRTFVRDKIVYIRLRNEQDEAERKHIQDLRQKARAKKTVAHTVAHVAKNSPISAPDGPSTSDRKLAKSQ